MKKFIESEKRNQVFPDSAGNFKYIAIKNNGGDIFFLHRFTTNCCGFLTLQEIMTCTCLAAHKRAVNVLYLAETREKSVTKALKTGCEVFGTNDLNELLEEK